MGRNHVHVQGHHCDHCCRDVVCLPTPGDVLRLALTTGADPQDFLEFPPPGEIQGVA